jgi:hypothetical protein
MKFEFVSWDSSVNIVSAYRLNDQGFIPGKDRDLYFLSAHPD